MNGLTILLVLVSILGCLPLVFFVVKKISYHRLLSNGRKTNAYISAIKPGVRGRYGIVNEKVFYYFTTADGRQYEGMFVSGPRKHRRDDVLEVYYQQENPAANSVKTSGYGIGYLVFMLAIAIAVALVMFRIYRTVNGGG